MSGPVAPKDPEKDRSYFYIMKEKETFGSLQTQGEYQGRGVQFIYESDGRLESSAEVTGEVCDEEILKKLGTVDRWSGSAPGSRAMRSRRRYGASG